MKPAPGLHSLNLLCSNESLKSVKDFLYFLLLPSFWYSLNFPQTKQPNFPSLKKGNRKKKQPLKISIFFILVPSFVLPLIKFSPKEPNFLSLKFKENLKI